MPVHFIVANHDAQPVRPRTQIESPIALVNTDVFARRALPTHEVWQSTFSKEEFSFTSLAPNLRHMKDGFVNTVIQAYSRHQHLILRPDDVWIAVLSQFNIYVNKHAEELRSHFVAHGDQVQLTVSLPETDFDFGDFALRMGDEISKSVVDEELKHWILPNFTTTTPNDTVVSAVMMMSTLKAYFTYRAISTDCGLPSVTLEGEKADWESLLFRLDQLHAFGPEPAEWAKLLQPIFTRFVQAFDGNPDVDFWNRVCSIDQMSGSSKLSGWITAFCVWNQDGGWRGTARPTYESSDTIDGVRYPTISIETVANGRCEFDVAVKLVSEPTTLNCKMISGHVAGLVEGENRDTLRPFPAWFMLRPLRNVQAPAETSQLMDDEDDLFEDDDWDIE